MQIAQLLDTSQGLSSIQMHMLSKADRARLSGAGIRTFVNIADQWELTEKQRVSILGDPGRSTYYAWLRKAENQEALSLPLDTLLRISAVLGIYKSLAILFLDSWQAILWLRGEHKGTIFNGMSPLSLIVDGSQDGMLSVRRYLDGWRGGHAGHGAQEGTYEPVTEEGIIFV